jgi:hypothetical protein
LRNCWRVTMTREIIRTAQASSPIQILQIRAICR